MDVNVYETTQHSSGVEMGMGVTILNSSVERGVTILNCFVEGV